jgi:membrane-bound serine protease (ClpP class)
MQLDAQPGYSIGAGRCRFAYASKCGRDHFLSAVAKMLYRWGMMPRVANVSTAEAPDMRKSRRRTLPGPFACAAGVLAALLLLATATVGQERGAADKPALLIDITGAIGFVSAAHLARAVEQASTRAAPVLIVRMDTPGGLLSSTREMIHTILASRVPVVMYVAPNGSRAASAGTYLLYAAHVAAMAPSTHMGAATPIALSPGLPGSTPAKPSPGSDKQSDSDPSAVSARKSVNDAVAYIRSLAEMRGRNADWAEKAVREAATLTASAAHKERVIDVIAKDVDDLLAQIDGRTVATPAGDVRLDTRGRKVVTIEQDWKMKVMSVITDPNIALILLMIGIYGILFEFWSPGAIAPGAVGGISLIVALTALSVLPVSFGGLALLILGIALMVAEAFTPSFGIAGLGGIVAFALGALFLFDPQQSDVPIAVSWQVIAGLALLSAAFFAGVLGLAVRARRRPVRIGGDDLVGSTAVVARWAENSGLVQVAGELWEARSGQTFAKGQKVRIVGRTGLTLSIEASS